MLVLKVQLFGGVYKSANEVFHRACAYGFYEWQKVHTSFYEACTWTQKVCKLAAFYVLFRAFGPFFCILLGSSYGLCNPAPHCDS